MKTRTGTRFDKATVIRELKLVGKDADNAESLVTYAEAWREWSRSRDNVRLRRAFEASSAALEGGYPDYERRTRYMIAVKNLIH